MALRMGLAIAALLLAALTAGADEDSYRLPLQVVPSEYDVALVPFLDNAGNRTFTFDGVVRIKVKALKADSKITLHAQDMDIQEITIPGLTIVSFGLEPKRDFLTISFTESLVVGEVYDITIRFIGNLNNKLEGFYRSSYKTPDGVTRWLGTTQFEATSARRAFPCFDEPALKATFVIRIAPPVGLHAVSNMPVDSITGPDPTNENRYWYNFQRSVIMSTYLVAFVVSDFSFVEHGPFRILGRPHAIDYARYPLSVSPLILSAIANLTEVEYTLPKMDQVAVPDFSAGAMENWGLVTYRQGYLLIEDDTERNRRLAATVIGHEFGHQWFGNLVSPLWWTYTWLNEAFATFFEYVATDKVEPQWNLLHSMVTSMQHNILYLDSISYYSHPITRYVETPSQISSSFDSITYSKGGALVKMVYHFLTEPTFYKGLNIYLNKRAYDAAEPDDLFEAWQEAASADGVLPSGLSVKEILDTWTLQAGYPVLTVTRDYDAGTATVTQKHFVAMGSTGDQRWYVPISYTTRRERNFNRTAPSVWLSPEEGSSVTLEGIAADDWLVLNIQDAAYYRVNYDEKNWKLLSTALNEPEYDGIHLLNRAQILDDANRLGINLQLEPTVSLDIINSLQSESEPVVWITMLRQLEQLYDHLANSNHLRNLKATFAPFVETMSRSRTQDIAVIGKEVQDWASALSDIDVKRQRRTNEDSPAEWCAAVRMDSGAWDATWRRYEEALSISARRDALAALGCARDASRLLDAAVADADAGAAESVRPEDVGAALAAPCGSETRRAVGGGGEDACTQAVAFIAQNTVKVQGLLGDSDEYLSLVRRLAQRIRTEEQYNMLHLAATAVHFGQRPLLRAEVWADVLATARARVDWAAGAGAPVLAWLKQHAHGRQ